MTTAALRALLEKATPGRWKAERAVSDTLDCDAEYVVDATDPMLLGVAHADEADAALIVAAVNALSALLDIADELRKTIGEPQPVPETVMEGPNVVEHYMGEMVCVHCGQHGNAAYNIEHEADCTYVSGTAALAKLETP